MPNTKDDVMLPEWDGNLSGSLSEAPQFKGHRSDAPKFAILPWGNVVMKSVGSIMDRGRAAVASGRRKRIVANLPRISPK